ncbi:MAG: hypothetical protein JXR64_02715, partial [Spirochaetales bacterium]|nr:hypothetical protein [Spirochaetales bacterium]
NDPINYIDPNGLVQMVAGDLTYNDRNDKFAFTDGRSVKDNTTIEIQRTPGHTNGHFKSDLTVEIDGIVVYGQDVQSWADIANPKTNDMTVPADTYTGTLLENTGSYDKPIKFQNETTGVGTGNDDWFMIHGSEKTRGDLAGQKWSLNGNSAGCQILQGQAESYNNFTETLESAGYSFNGKDTIDINIKDPVGIHTTTDGKEIKKGGGC